jgi:hypothetical protein
VSETIGERLDKAEKRIKDPNFRMNKGLGNEVGYYIFDYPESEELLVRRRIKEWEKRIDKLTDGFGLRVFDLYDIMIDYLVNQNFLEKCFEFEKNGGMKRVTDAIGHTLRLSEDAGVVVKHICDNIPDREMASGGTVVFLIGVGKCYPVMRSHKVLNNLHLLLDHVPVVMFYPGKYDGQELVLFSAVKDDNYYRALKLV